MPAMRVSVLSNQRREHHYDEVKFIKAVQDGSVQGGKDARVERVIEAGEVQGRLHTGQGIDRRGPSSNRCSAPFLLISA